MNAAPVRAPEIDRQGTTWFNVTGPLSLEDVAGRFVILDFWTFCCINCMHVLPALKRIEEDFPEDVVVIGVHTPKFFAEREADNVTAALQRYDIRHPVIHDPNMTLWREYAVRAWPTLVFIDPAGYVLGQFAGEPDSEKLHRSISGLVRQARDEDMLRPQALDLVDRRHETGTLSFPGKIKPVPGRNAWAIADAGHHQIVLVDEDGAVQTRYGSGRRGFVDGTARESCFADPQGLTASEQAIFVADTGNHALRRIDLADGAVTTLAGTGRRGRPLGSEAITRETALASPWDLELHDDRLYVANAGTHQLGVVDLAQKTVRRLAGTGAEALVDGEALDEAVLAQPSGLARDETGRRLAFADSETSAIRILDLDEGKVSTLVGAGLFEFGLQNGPLKHARFQHPLGLVWTAEGIVVADSYNRAVRLVDVEAGEVRSIEPGLTCLDPVCLRLGEPAGVVVRTDGRLLLSDTNNHRILLLDPNERTYITWLS
ncbi:MAG: hypothetical protein CMM46_13255 [Rhodospirillaceae bacterium]|nr:hypothetical protein [Rhodospirillaceae bacterium]|tara:strand:+ start:6589 stop:8052 length:1464 start_codon:yes stop_codon:yes gene_type:complete